MMFFALFVIGVLVVLGGFVMRRLGEMGDACVEKTNGVDVGEICGEKE